VRASGGAAGVPAFVLAVPKLCPDGLVMLQFHSLGNPALRSCPLLLCVDAQVVQEINASAEAILASPQSGAEARSRLRSALLSVGRGLHYPSPDVSRELAAAGCVSAMRMGWRRTARRLLTALAAAGGAPPVAPLIVAGTDGTLAHSAALCGGWAVEAVAAAGGELAGLGCAASLGVRQAARLTPLHLAALAASGDALEALTATPHGAAAWFVCRNARGLTARQTLARLARSGSAPAAAALARLDALHLQSVREAGALLQAARELLDDEHGVCSLHLQLDLGSQMLLSDPSFQPLRELASSPAVLALTAALFDAHARELTRAEAAAASDQDASCAARPATVASFGIAPRFLPSPEAKRVYAHCIISLMAVIRFFICSTWMGIAQPPLSEEAIRAAMPHAPWDVWQRTPTVACSSHLPRVQHARAAVSLLAALSAVLSLSPGPLARAFRRRHMAGLSAALTGYGLLVDPVLSGLATHALYGLGLRQPWQAGARQLLMTSVAHACTEGSLPSRAYAAIMLVRGMLPLVARAAQWWVLSGGEGPLAWGLAACRLLLLQPAWDLVHLLFCAACVRHHLAMRAQLARVKIKDE